MPILLLPAWLYELLCVILSTLLPSTGSPHAYLLSQMKRYHRVILSVKDEQGAGNVLHTVKQTTASQELRQSEASRLDIFFPTQNYFFHKEPPAAVGQSQLKIEHATTYSARKHGLTLSRLLTLFNTNTLGSAKKLQWQSIL